MGALPQLSVVAGPHRDLQRRLIHRLFERNVAHNAATAADATALITLVEDAATEAAGDETPAPAERRCSYAELNTTANRYARAMRGHIVDGAATRNADGDWIVAVCMPPSEQLIAVLLAVWKLGAAYLPLEASFPAQRIEHILGEARPALTIVAAAGTQSSFAGVRYWAFEELQAAAGADERWCVNLAEHETLHAAQPNDRVAENGRADEDDQEDDDGRLAIVLYTSGSTGIPKGVRLPHSIIHNRLRWQFETFPFAATERTAVFKTALTFVDSVAEIWAPLLSGLAVLILPKAVIRDPERLVDVLEAYRIERLVLVPTLLRALLMYVPLRTPRQPALLHALRIWVCSGETLSAQLVREFYAHFAEGRHVLCNFYGSTEIMGDVTYHVCAAGGGDDGGKKDGIVGEDTVPIGYPIDNTVVYVLDGEMRPVKLGERGELYVAGRNLAAGYVGGREKFRFVANPLSDDPVYDRLYRTGDYASVRDDGTVRYDGRTDSQIKIRGHRVDLAEVERQLMLTGLPDKGLVLCHRAGEIDQALVAFVTLRDDHNAGDGAALIEAALASRLTDYMRPLVVVVESIPLLVNGKVDRQTLLRAYADSAATIAGCTNGGDGGGAEAVPAFDYAGVQPQHTAIARDLFETIGAAIGRSARRVISLGANFYHLGGNSLNSIYTVTQLRAMGYSVGIQEFIKAGSLGEILEMMADRGVVEQVQNGNGHGKGVDVDLDPNNNEVVQYEVMPLAKEHRKEVIELMTHSFYEKADLERLLKPHIVYKDYADIFEDLYDVVCREGLSFVVYDAQLDRIVGAALNTDAHSEPPLQIRSQLAVVFDFLQELQRSVRLAHPTTATGQLFHAGMMGTCARLNAQENIAAMHRMEVEVLRVAHRMGYAGVFTTNTSPLTQQLASHVHGYETVCSAQVNRWQTPEGWRPFALAPDDQTALVQWKRIG